MPVRNLGLTHLPAEEDVLAVAVRREIDQALVHVLDLHAKRIQEPHALRDRVRFARDGLRGSANLARRQVPAVCRDAGDQLCLVDLRMRQRTSVRDETLRERTYLVERSVRFLRSENPLHTTMITGP